MYEKLVKKNIDTSGFVTGDKPATQINQKIIDVNRRNPDTSEFVKKNNRL